MSRTLLLGLVAQERAGWIATGTFTEPRTLRGIHVGSIKEHVQHFLHRTQSIKMGGGWREGIFCNGGVCLLNSCHKRKSKTSCI